MENPEKRLVRSRTDRLIFGVCGGLGQYLGVDSNLVRLAFVVLTLFSGAGILLYLALALIMPAEGAAEIPPREALRENLRELRESAVELGREVRGAIRRS